jgi:hypothetical protein
VPAETLELSGTVSDCDMAAAWLRNLSLGWRRQTGSVEDPLAEGQAVRALMAIATRRAFANLFGMTPGGGRGVVAATRRNV